MGKWAWDVCVRCGWLWVCAHTHPSGGLGTGGGVRECCLQGAAQHMLCEQRSDDKAQQSSSDPRAALLPDPPQTSLSGSSGLPLPTAASGRVTSKTQKREELLWEERRGADGQHCPLCSGAALLKSYYLKPLKLWGLFVTTSARSITIQQGTQLFKIDTVLGVVMTIANPAPIRLVMS